MNDQPYTVLNNYRLTPNDTKTAALYHIESEYFNFQQSMRGAISANGTRPHP